MTSGNEEKTTANDAQVAEYSRKESVPEKEQEMSTSEAPESELLGDSIQYKLSTKGKKERLVFTLDTSMLSKRAKAKRLSRMLGNT